MTDRTYVILESEPTPYATVETVVDPRPGFVHATRARIAGEYNVSVDLVQACEPGFEAELYQKVWYDKDHFCVRDCDQDVDASAVTEHYVASGEDDITCLFELEEAEFLVGDRVEGGKPGTEDYDWGTVVEVVGDQVEVAWRGSETRTTQPASSLRPGWVGREEHVQIIAALEDS